MQVSYTATDIGKGISEGSSRKVTYGFHFIEEKMGHSMEDYHVAQFKEFDGHEVGLFAIFDGHSGNDVATYLRNHLFDNILHQLYFHLHYTVMFFNVNWLMFYMKKPEFWTDTMKAIGKAYRRTNAKILKRKEGDVKRRGGSTAVTVILIDGRKLVVANVGDSRAVLSEKRIARQLSVDHEPLKESENIENGGGFVTHERGNVPRVDGQLAMSRAFGDGTLKEHMISDFDVVIETIDDDAEMIILASDGLWKVMSNQEAVDTIQGMKDAQEAAMELNDEALNRGSSLALFFSSSNLACAYCKYIYIYIDKLGQYIF
ncbi:putative protein-serine/threonine phosphatase [Dioscorea sansibarensis]